MADRVVFSPYLAHSGYIHNVSGINLNDGVNTVCSVRESRIFTYSIQNNSAAMSSREFDLTIVVMNSAYRNKVVDVLTAPASAVTVYGTLEVNGWALVCQCTGITEISNEKGGKYKFKARFYTPDMTWTKVYGLFKTNLPSNGNRFWYKPDGTKISETYLELPAGQYGFCLIVNSDGVAQRNFVLTVEEKSAETPSAERFDKTLTIGYKPGEIHTINSEFLTKTVEDESYASFMPYVPFTSDLFVKMPYCEYKLSTNTVVGAGSYDIVTVLMLRGMPEWEL